MIGWLGFNTPCIGSSESVSLDERSPPARVIRESSFAGSPESRM